MTTLTRRYDVDWLRVIAIGLLLVYHVAIAFQPWGIMIGFITNKESWQPLWLPMGMLNIWRIPLLFVVSGMGVYFAMQQRNLKELISERTKRILVPLIFGTLCIAPLSPILQQYYYGWKISYGIHPGHLWFLGNIFVYVVLLAPVFYYIRKRQNTRFILYIRKLFGSPLAFFPVAGLMVMEVVIIKPIPFELYVMTAHGFVLGLVTFLSGFLIMLAGDSFWKSAARWRWFYVAIGAALFTVRMFYFGLRTPMPLIPIESCCWIFAVLGFGHRYLNRAGSALRYLSEAAYPVYIVHMLVLYTGSIIIFPLSLSAPLKFILLLIFTFSGCLLVYEFIIRRIKLLRPFFGLKHDIKRVRVAAVDINTSRDRANYFAPVESDGK